MNRAIKYRIYPNAAQSEFFAKTFGCCRKVYNLMLDTQQKRYTDGLKHLSKYDSFKYFNNNVKPLYSYMKEADSLALMNAVFNLDEAYQRFFKHIGEHPKFKSKRRSKKSYTTNNQKGTVAINLEESIIKLPKVGCVKAKLHRKPFEGMAIKSATVSQTGDGKYYVSVLFENAETVSKKIVSTNTIGLDYKETGLYVDSNNECCNKPDFHKLNAKKLAKAQRRLSRMTGSKKGEAKSKNWIKQSRKVNRIHTYIHNCEMDFLHKLSNEITNRYDVIAVEDISIKEMYITDKSKIKQHNVNKRIADGNWNWFTTMLEYKADAKGKYFVKVDSSFPSTKRCSCCGAINPIDDVRIHHWACTGCGTEHERNYNAAVNIRNEALRMLGVA